MQDIYNELAKKLKINKIEHCPICHSTDSSPFEIDQIGHKLINGVKCDVCGLIYMDGVIDQDDLPKFYDGYNQARNVVDEDLEAKRRKMYILDNEYSMKFCSSIGLNILDIGCSEGDFLNTFGPNHNKMGIEIDKVAVSKGLSKYPDISFYLYPYLI